MPSPPSLPLQVGARLGVYEILSLLGEGGMGAVYRARDTKLGRDVAIKVVSDGYAGSLNIQFPRGIRADGVHYVVDELELSTDGTLSNTTARIGQWSTDEDNKIMLSPMSGPATLEKPGQTRSSRALISSGVSCFAGVENVVCSLSMTLAKVRWFDNESSTVSILPRSQ